MQEFDPLQTADGFDLEILSAAKKREIKNILKSYVGLFDSFSELIQNSMDAVEKRSEDESESYEKKIWLTIDLQNNLFSITDNGIAFNETEFKSFLAPNISFKNGQGTRGNKGVGATYIAYGFNDLQIGTKSESFEYLGRIKEGRKWAEDQEGIITRPKIKEDSEAHEFFEEIDRGSTFTIRYGGEFTRPKKLSYFSATSAEQWLYLLLLKTPLGGIDLFNKNEKNIKFYLEVKDKDGNLTKKDNIDAKYIYPHQKINASVDIKDINKAQKKLLDKGLDTSKLPSSMTKLNGLYEYFTKEEVLSLPTNRINDEVKEIIDQYDIEAYGYFGYTTNIWDEFNDRLAKLRKGYRVLRGGLVIANNQMLQGDYIAIPLTSNIGYQNQTHVVVHLNNADPDLGRKGFQPEVKEVAEIISVGIVNKLKKWKSQLKNNTGSKPSIKTQIDLHKWIRSQETYEDTHPLNLKNKHFFKPVNEISITSIPQSEQDVIVLFNQLIAGGVIRGLKLLATSQYATYDGIYKYFVEAPEENHIFDKEKNPLGVQELGIPINTVSNPNVLEYKYNLDALFDEFENEDKYEKDINLAIAWEMGNKWKKNYEITSLLDLENLHHREFHGITHIITSGNTSFNLIILKELLEYLNDLEGSQKIQKEMYGEELFS